MANLEAYDMNGVVQIVLIDNAAETAYLPEVYQAVSRAAEIARVSAGSDDPRKDLLQQVIDQMSPTLLRVTPTNVARNEVFISPWTLAYAYIANECWVWLGVEDAEVDLDEPRYEDVLAMNGLGIYEQGGHASREDDAIVLDNVIQRIGEDIELSENPAWQDVLGGR